MRRNFLKSIIGVAIIPVIGQSQTKPRTNPSAKTIAEDLLKLSNKIQASQMSKTDRDRISEVIESLSAKIQKDYNTGALCATDSECSKKFERY